MMNLKDRFAEFVLTAFDRLMNVITFGLWEQRRGEVSWMDIKVKDS
jgi:hypothetical protein